MDKKDVIRMLMSINTLDIDEINITIIGENINLGSSDYPIEITNEDIIRTVANWNTINETIIKIFNINKNKHK